MKKPLGHYVESIAALQSRLSANSFAASHASRLHMAARALVELAEAKTTDHPARHAERVSNAAARYAEVVTTSKADFMEREMGGRNSLHEQFAKAVGLQADRYAVSVVESFGRMNTQQKLEALTQIADKCDGRALAALMEAPSFTHGVSGDHLAKFAQKMEADHTPGIAALRGRFENDLQTARVAFETAETLAAEALKLHDLDAALAGQRQADAAEQRLADA